MRSCKVGETHGSIDAQSKGQQGNHFDNQPFAKAFETEKEKDDGDDDIKVVLQISFIGLVF